MHKYTSIDLFSGPGGLATGFRWGGVKPLIAVEWSDWTVQTYAASHDAEIFELEKYINGTLENVESYFSKSEKTLLIHGDINKVEGSLIKKILTCRFGVDSVDIVTGGAPCESFSMAGDRKEDDDRNTLFINILRIAREVDSKMFLFENVKGLFSKKLDGKHGKMYETICDDFERKIEGKPSFKLASRDKDVVLLKAVNYGVPQNRERLFLVGINEKYKNAKFIYPNPTHGPNTDYQYVTVADAILDLPVIESGEENNYYSYDTMVSKEQQLFLNYMRGEYSQPPEHLNFNEHSLSVHKAPGHIQKMKQRLSLIKQGEGMQSAYNRLILEGKEDLVKECFPKKIYAARNRRLKPNEPSFTVTSHCLDEMVHPIQDRGLSPREVARLQSFPDWYIFKGPFTKFHSDPEQDLYEQIGDAIPPLLAYALVKEVVKTLNSITENSRNEGIL